MPRRPRRAAARVSEPVRELWRQGAERVLRAPPQWLAELDAATLSPPGMKGVADDPALAAALRRTNRANLVQWAAANIADPGAPVTPNLSPDALRLARDLVRRGFSETALHAYRAGQNSAWLRWMSIVFELSSDPDELQELLEASARSISAFIDETIAKVSAQVAAERQELSFGSQAERREMVALLLQGAPVQARLAEQRLGYRLDQAHRAAVIFADDATSELGALERVAEALAQASGVARPLVIVASAATLWVWLPASAAADLAAVRAALRRSPAVRVALGSEGAGVEGFRRSHRDATTVQRMVARLGTQERVVSFDEVQLVALVTEQPDAADQFVKQALGPLETASLELQDALHCFLAEGSNAVRTAARLRTHRNTLLRRLERAEALLPRPLAHDRIQVAVALEVLRWRRAR